MILGLDTATGDLAVAAAGADRVIARQEVGPDETGRPRHARELLPTIESVVESAGGWPAIERLAVGVGPGTFTGLRIGIATARALAQARELPIVGVSSLAALAAGIGGDRAPTARRLALIDAKRQEMFGALFDAEGERLWEDSVFTPDELGARLGSVDAPVVAFGDGALRFRDSIAAAGVEVLAADDPAHRVSAEAVCAIGARAAPGLVADIEPNYLRRPDAEVWSRGA